MQRLLKIELDRKHGSYVPQLVYDAKCAIPKLSSVSNNGIIELQHCLLDIANSRCKSAHPAFKQHFESILCAISIAVQNILTTFKQGGHRLWIQ